MNKKKDDTILEAMAEQRKYLDEKGYKTCCTKVVETFGDSIFKREKVVVVTDLALFIFKKTGKKPSATYLWQTIEGIDLQGDSVSMQFKDGFIGIKTIEISLVFGAISDVLMRVLTREELEEIGLLRLEVQNVFPSPTSVFARFKNQIKIMKIKISDESFEIIRSIISEMTATINIGIFQDLPKILPIIYDIFKIARFITTVIIPDTVKPDPFEIASEIALSRNFVNNIVFECAPTKEYNKFLKALGEGNSSITGIYFNNGLLTEEQLENLSAPFSKKKMGVLGFRSCIDGGAMPYFYNTFLRTKVSKSLTVLNLDGTRNINTSALLLSMPYLTVLSVANCDLEVAGVFKSIFEAPIIKLHVLNISGNKSSLPVEEFRFVPSSLTSITCDNVEWAEGTLIPFMRLILKSFKTGVKLSLAYAKATTNEYTKLFNFLCQGQFSSLASFVWDGNPVESKLIEFLIPNKGLEYLSLNGCFDKAFEGPILALVNYLPKATHLKCFFSRGSERASFGSYTPRVCAALKTCTTLRLIDISESRSGSDGLTAMGQLMETMDKRILITDGVYPQNPDQFSTFVTLALGNENIMLSYPEKDIEWIKENNMVSPEQIEYFKSQFMRVPKRTQPKKSQYTAPAVSSFEQPFVVYKYQGEEGFPVYFTKQTIDELRATAKTQVVSQPAFLQQQPVSKKLTERMVQAQKMIYGENVQPVVEERVDPPTYVPQSTAADEDMEIEQPEPVSVQSSEKRRKTRDIPDQSAEELPRQSDSRSQADTRSTQEEYHRTAPTPRSRKDAKKATKKSIVNDWTFPTITLAVNVEQFWEDFEEDFSIKNLYSDIKGIKKAQEYQE